MHLNSDQADFMEGVLMIKLLEEGQIYMYFEMR